MGSARSLRQGTDRCWRRSARSATPLPRRRLDTIDTTGRHARGPVRVSSRSHPIYRNNLHVPTVVGNSFRETSAHGGTVYLRRWCGVAGLRREHPGGHYRASEQTPNDVRLPMASSASVASLGPVGSVPCSAWERRRSRQRFAWRAPSWVCWSKPLHICSRMAAKAKAQSSRSRMGQCCS
jgi:hypothetical protein